MENANPQIIACFPLYPPEELFNAFDFNPITFLDLNSQITDFFEANRHLEAFTCRVARVLVQNIYNQAMIKSSKLAAIFFYNACDTLRNTPEILQNSLINANAIPLPLFNIHIPQTNLIPEKARQFLRNEIQTLIRKLENHFHIKFNPERFSKSVARYNEYKMQMRQLDTQVTNGVLGFKQFVLLADSLAGTPVNGKIEKIKNFILQFTTVSLPVQQQENKKRPRILISGILRPPQPIIEVIENAGLIIVGNDIASLSRTYFNLISEKLTPEDYYVEFYFNHIPCPTLLASSEHRLNYLIQLCQEKHADGIIFLGEKYCEYEFFEFPYLTKKLREKGIATLELELHFELSDKIESYKTRIEEFASILKGAMSENE